MLLLESSSKVLLYEKVCQQGVPIDFVQSKLTLRHHFEPFLYDINHHLIDGNQSTEVIGGTELAGCGCSGDRLCSAIRQQ
jgi:hypothetical protein